jgi:hypothetical protein
MFTLDKSRGSVRVRTSFPQKLRVDQNVVLRGSPSNVRIVATNGTHCIVVDDIDSYWMSVPNCDDTVLYPMKAQL